MLLGEKDTIVDNTQAREWHAKTNSKIKELKLIAEDTSDVHF